MCQTEFVKTLASLILMVRLMLDAMNGVSTEIE